MPNKQEFINSQPDSIEAAFLDFLRRSKGGFSEAQPMPDSLAAGEQLLQAVLRRFIYAAYVEGMNAGYRKALADAERLHQRKQAG